jgi:hypothetical protein
MFYESATAVFCIPHCLLKRICTLYKVYMFVYATTGTTEHSCLLTPLPHDDYRKNLAWHMRERSKLEIKLSPLPNVLPWSGAFAMYSTASLRNRFALNFKNCVYRCACCTLCWPGAAPLPCTVSPSSLLRNRF